MVQIQLFTPFKWMRLFRHIIHFIMKAILHLMQLLLLLLLQGLSHGYQPDLFCLCLLIQLLKSVFLFTIILLNSSGLIIIVDLRVEGALLLLFNFCCFLKFQLVSLVYHEGVVEALGEVFVAGFGRFGLLWLLGGLYVWLECAVCFLVFILLFLPFLADSLLNLPSLVESIKHLLPVLSCMHLFG